MRRVYYHTSHYISHKTAALANIAALQANGVNCVSSPEEADILILHDDPYQYAPLLTQFGHKTCVAYAVWEADILPQIYHQYLQGISHIWTCSNFSAQTFLRAGYKDVSIVPHITSLSKVEEPVCTAMRQRIGCPPSTFLFYTIVDSINPRKNLQGLLQTFLRTFRGDPAISLVVKQYRQSWDLSQFSNVISIDETLTNREIAALHHICDAYVSAHHAEAWGISLSDAMSVGNPVIATGFSGNMHYMNNTNSFPVQYTMVPVSEAMCEKLPLFTPSMRWAAPDMNHFGYLMKKVAQKRYPEAVRTHATQICQEFSADQVGKIMVELLKKI